MAETYNTEEVEAAREKRRKKKRGRKRLKKVLLVILIILLLLLLGVVGAYFGLRASGKRKLEEKGADQKQVLQENEEAGVEVVDENSVRYQGKLYTYNTDMMNIVFMGIDQNVEQQDEGGSQGRSDLVILAAVDNLNRKVTLFNINRNTMTDIAIYDEAGNYLRQSTTQLALAHSYGDGKEQSAKLVCDAVSNLLYGLPIHAYCALNVDAIPELNDAIGGVTVTLTRDYTELDSSYVQGATVTLWGDAALQFVRIRDITVEQSNEDRMERQKQYMQAFIAQTKAAVQQDLGLPLGLYRTVQPYMVTDISADQAVYLATQLLGYEVSGELLTLPGTVVQGALYEEYHIDETALYDLIIQTFYEPAEEDAGGSGGGEETS